MAAIQRALDSSNRPLATIVAQFLSVLHDPATRLITGSDQLRFANGPPGPVVANQRDGVVVISLNRYSDISVAAALPATESRVADALRALDSAAGLILDVRADPVGTRSPDDIYWTRDFIERILRQTTTTAVAVPVLRDVVRTEFPSEWRAGDDGRASRFAFYQVPASSFIQPAAGAKDVPTVIIANGSSELPAYAAGLIHAGHSVLLTEGGIADGPFVRYRDVPLRGQTRAQVRLSELVYDDGTGGVSAIVIADTASGAILERAYAALNAGRVEPALGPRVPISALQHPISLNNDPLPSEAERVFALLKVWSSIEAFYPTQSLSRWQTVLEDLLPAFIAAQTPLDYHLAVARLLNRLEDSHASLASPLVARWRGGGAPPLQLGAVEGQVVVRNVSHDSLHGGTRVRPGDVVLTIDGEDALARGWRLVETMSYSTSARGEFQAGAWAALGEAGSSVTMTLRDSRQEVYTVTLPRIEPARISRDILSRSPPVRWVADDIGYINVARVPADAVDAAFATLEGARAIVFDWRGSTANSFPFVARLLTRDSVPMENVRCSASPQTGLFDGLRK